MNGRQSLKWILSGECMARFAEPWEEMGMCKSLGKLLFAILFVTMAWPLMAQVTGSITGSVSDSTGAMVPGAKVSILASETGITRTAAANSVGEYLVTNLSQGSYTVTVSATGFKTYVAKNVILRVGENIRRDAKLAIGEASTEVVVEGSAAGSIEAQTSELSSTIDAAQINDLVLNGRSFATLVMLAPGVSDQTGQDEAGIGPTGSVSYAINGGRTEYNNWEIDGGDVMDSGSMANLTIFPNVDALEEVQILTSSYDASYGRSGSGTIEAVTKSGTNQFHGEGFEFLKNQMFNARNYFNPVGEQLGSYHKNDFGYLLGGPIKKDKLFFFWSQEFRKEEVPGFYQNITLPTVAERAGDFSAICPTPGTEFVRQPDPNQPKIAVNPDCPAYSHASNGNLLGFAHNSVAPYIDKVNANALLSSVPLPNIPATTSNGGNNFQLVAPAPMNWHEELIKIDDEITPKLHGNIRFIHDSWHQDYLESSPWSNSTIPGIPGQEIGPGVSLVSNLTWTPSATFTNQFVFAYGANHLTLTNTSSAAKKPAGMTMTGLFDNNFGGMIPTLTVSAGESYTGFTQDAGPLPFYSSNPTYTYRDTVTKLLKRHTLKAGFYFTANQKNEDVNLYPGLQGQVVFTAWSNDYSSAGSTTTGSSFADMLVGDVHGFGQSNTKPKYYFRFKIFEPYVQDDWHATSRLTLNVGLRMSMFGLYTEKIGQAYNFDPAHYSAANMPKVNPDSPYNLIFSGSETEQNLSGMVHCGYNGTPAGCMTGHLWNPAPRFGFAYDPTGRGKTVLRGAYGIFYEHTNGNEANAESTESQPPLVFTPWEFNIRGYAKIGGDKQKQQYWPMAIQSVPTKVKWPYMQQYHFDVQQEFFKNILMTVSYVGSRGTHLTSENDLNQFHDLNQKTNPFATHQAITNDICSNLTVDGTTGGTPIGDDALFHLNAACGNFPTDDLYRENYPGWGTVQYVGQDSNSNYNALQVSARRQAKDLELTAAYTYSHSLDNASDRWDANFVDSYNMKANHASSNFDQRQIFNMTYIWHLPFFAHSAPLTHSLLGGWEWSGITIFQSGEPFSVTNGSYSDNAGVANGIGSGSYVDFAPGVSRKYHGPKFVTGISGPILFNPSIALQPRALTFGNSGRNSFNMSHRTQFDMGLFKQFVLPWKGTAFQFRAEGFNVFNHPQFNGVNNQPGCYYPSGSYQFTAGASECVNGNSDDGVEAQGFFHANGAHAPRILQLAAKITF
jgi:hypothetical protein